MPAGPLVRFLVAVALVTTSAHAQDSFWVVYNGSTLYDLDITTMSATKVGPIGVVGVGSIAMTSDGTLYTIGTYTDDLYTIDETTGAATFVASLGQGFDLSMGMAVDPTTDKMYASLSAYVGYASDLVEIDRYTGTVTPITTTSYRCMVGLDFDDTGKLFAIDGCPPDELFTIDLVSGSETVPTPGGLSAWPFLSNFAFGSSGVMYSIHSDGNVVVIDRTTGLGTPIGVPTGLPFGWITGLTAKEPARQLVGYPPQISLSSGGSQVLSLYTSPLNAGKTYLVLGSASGTSPGIAYAGQAIPLNADAYTVYSLLNAGSYPLSGSAGQLDASGQATASFTLFPAADPSLVGITVNHAGVVLELVGAALTVTYVTNAASCLLAP